MTGNAPAAPVQRAVGWCNTVGTALDALAPERLTERLARL